MNEHLTGTQISEWIAGERSPKHQRHLAECSRCSAELAGFEASLSELGHSVRAWAQHAARGASASVAPIPAIASWRWAVAAVASAALALVPFYWSGEVETETTRLGDVQLLEHIDMQLSRSVPATMEPLLELMAKQEDGKDGIE